MPDFCSGFSGDCSPACVAGSCVLQCGSTTPTPTPPALTQRVLFKIKFAGVTGDGAQGAKVAIKFQKDTLQLQLNNSLTATHVGNGIYEVSATISNPLPSGGGYTILVKGEKHLARKFCRSQGQTGACTSGETITMLTPTATSIQTFDFTGIPLEPGDLPPQDGFVGQTDFNTIKTLQAKPSDQLTLNDLHTGDLNYDHVISTWDIFWMRKTLETKTDEQ
jgi:hypothetical protein